MFLHQLHNDTLLFVTLGDSDLKEEKDKVHLTFT